MSWWRKSMSFVLRLLFCCLFVWIFLFVLLGFFGGLGRCLWCFSVFHFYLEIKHIFGQRLFHPAIREDTVRDAMVMYPEWWKIQRIGQTAHSGLLKQRVIGWIWNWVIPTLTERKIFSNNAELAWRDHWTGEHQGSVKD